MLAGRQLTSAPESTSMSTNSPSRTLGTPTEQISWSIHGPAFLICAPGLKDSFAHAAKVEVASNCANRGGVLAAHLARCGQIFHRMDLLLGTLGRQLPILARIPTRFGCACTLASPCPSYRLPLPWAAVFQKIDTHSPDDRLFHIFDTSCRSEGSLLKCDLCFRILDIIAGWASNSTDLHASARGLALACSTMPWSK